MSLPPRRVVTGPPRPVINLSKQHTRARFRDKRENKIRTRKASLLPPQSLYPALTSHLSFGHLFFDLHPLSLLRPCSSFILTLPPSLLIHPLCFRTSSFPSFFHCYSLLSPWTPFGPLLISLVLTSSYVFSPTSLFSTIPHPYFMHTPSSLLRTPASPLFEEGGGSCVCCEEPQLLTTEGRIE